MDLKQPVATKHVKHNVHQLPIAVNKAFPVERGVDFNNLVSQARRHQQIQAYLLQEARESESFARSNKAIRKIENMIDVINFSLFDFELMYERNQGCQLSSLLKDIIAILACTKTTLAQSAIVEVIDVKTCGDTYIMAIYASIETINYLLNVKSMVSEKLLDNLENMKTSLVYAIDEHLGS